MKVISLNGKWKCKSDNKNMGVENKWYLSENYYIINNDLLDIDIPKSFNLIKEFEDFEGIFWHFYQFDLTEEIDYDKYDYQIIFKGANYYTKVWLNGNLLGEHNGGFTPFSFNVNNSIKENDNLIVVRTDNIRRSDQIPGISFDWFNWGGIYRDIDLLILNKKRIKDVVIKTKILSRKESEIEVFYSILGYFSLNWQILDSTKKQILIRGVVSEKSEQGFIKINIKNPKLWSPDTPHLYYLMIFNNSLGSNDKLIFSSQFGIRQIEISGINIYLNKKKIFLKGVSLHEEHMPYGRTIPYEKRQEDVKTIKSLGFNAIRTAHYSHDEDLINIADKEGMLILEEIPVYQHCNFASSQTYNIAATMLKELIKRDINHPSVIWWSVGNEIPLNQRTCAAFIKKLMALARKLDNTRIVTCVSRKIISDLTRNDVDVATINTYFGWYFGHEKMISFILDLMRTPTFNKPWIYTEFGAGAKYGFRADWKKQIKFSEEKQLQVLDYTIRTVNSKDFFAGWFIWIYRDFKSNLRINKFQQGFNRKGIVSGEKNEKKLIFYRLPMILNRKRELINTRFIGLIIWIVLFPLSYLIFSRLVDFIISFIEKRPKLMKAVG